MCRDRTLTIGPNPDADASGAGITLEKKRGEGHAVGMLSGNRIAGLDVVV